MKRLLAADSTEARQVVSKLFENAPPVLVEVRFPGSGVSPDWHLCQDEDQLEQVLRQLGAGSELHVSSVWDLKNAKGEILLRK